jgi:hypothetical protein
LHFHPFAPSRFEGNQTLSVSRLAGLMDCQASSVTTHVTSSLETGSADVTLGHSNNDFGSMGLRLYQHFRPSIRRFDYKRACGFDGVAAMHCLACAFGILTEKSSNPSGQSDCAPTDCLVVASGSWATKSGHLRTSTNLSRPTSVAASPGWRGCAKGDLALEKLISETLREYSSPFGLP